MRCPSLHENIKCGNSLIGSDIYKDVQVTLDDPAVMKRINAFDWDVEFAEIMKCGIRRGDWEPTVCETGNTWVRI